MAYFFISAFGNTPTSGIYGYQFNPETGDFKQADFAQLRGAGYLAWSPDKKFLYATCNDTDSSDAVAAFRVEADQRLVFLGKAQSLGKSCCHLTVSANGKFVYAVNYHSGNFAEFAVNDSADTPISLVKIITHHGRGPKSPRQDLPHTHFANFTPDGKYLVIIDLGIDKIICYPFDAQNGVDENNPIANLVTPAGSGPRHLAWSPDGKFAYLINELGNTFFSYRYSDGRFTKLNELNLLPPATSCDSKAAAVRITDDGKYLVATNRGFDSLVVVALDGQGGMRQTQLTLSGGSSPRDVNFLPGEKYFAAAHEFSGNVRFFDFDRKSGTLTPNGREIIGMPRPLCVFW